MGAFNYNNPFIVFMVRLANMMIVSFYWVLCCIPVVTVLPACAALYHCVTRVVMASGPLGSETLVHLRIGKLELSALWKTEETEHLYRNQTVPVRFPENKLHFFDNTRL